MKVRQNYTLELNLIQRFKKAIWPQQRSQFVEDAIRAKLDEKEAYNLSDFTDDQLFHVIIARNYQKDGSTSLEKVLFEAIQQRLSNK